MACIKTPIKWLNTLPPSVWAAVSTSWWTFCPCKNSCALPWLTFPPNNMTYPPKKSAFNYNEGSNLNSRYDPAGPTQPQLPNQPQPGQYPTSGSHQYPSRVPPPYFPPE